MNEANKTALELVANNKGILAADESEPTMKKRFNAVGVESTEKNRLDYRSALFSTPDLENYISGIILFDETARQTIEGTPIPEFLSSKGIIPGIKVDQGAKPMAGHHPSQKITAGLDSLRERLSEYKEMGLRFTKWRAVFTVNPHYATVSANAWALAEFATRSQEAGLTPIVEPEVLMDGTHSLVEAYETIDWVLREVFYAIKSSRTALNSMILKVNMVMPGYDAKEQVDPDVVASNTLIALRRNVPVAVPGIAFLSGGQSDDNAVEHLKLMNKMAGRYPPWALSFSYGRALQRDALKIFSVGGVGVPGKYLSRLQDKLLERAKACHQACKAKNPSLTDVLTKLNEETESPKSPLAELDDF